jgi:hypothetical protein
VRVDRYTFNTPAAALVGILERAAVSDKTAERARSRWYAIGIGCIVLTFLAFFLGAMLAAATGVPGFLLAPLTIIGAIVSFILGARRGKFDLDDRKLASATRVVSLLRADIPADWPVALSVDFRPYQKTAPVEKTGGWTGPRASRYEQRWLELKSQLADGTSVSASITDSVSRKEKPKRKRTKVAERFSTTAVLVLRLDKRYGDAAAVASRLAGSTPDPAWTVKSCRGRGRVLKTVLTLPPGRRVQNRSTTESGMDGIANGDTLLRTLRWVYGGLTGRLAA